jgi:hypothetical protein
MLKSVYFCYGFRAIRPPFELLILLYRIGDAVVYHGIYLGNKWQFTSYGTHLAALAGVAKAEEQVSLTHNRETSHKVGFCHKSWVPPQTLYPIAHSIYPTHINQRFLRT